MHMTKTLALIYLCLILTACPSKNKSPGVQKTKVYMGDPKKLIEGTERDTDIWKFGLKDGESVYLEGYLAFNAFESDESSAADQEALEKENAASENPDQTDEDDSDLKFKISIDPNTNEIKFINKGIDLSFSITKTMTPFGPSLKLVNEIGTESAALSHVSFSEDRSTFTLLLFTYAPAADQSILYLKFERKPIPSFELKENTKYKFNLGPGLYMKWPRKSRVDICGTSNKTFRHEVRKSVARWNEVLPQKNKIVLQEKVENFKPFSDLNQHCIFLIDDFYRDPNKSIYRYGSTVISYNYENMNIIDADILLFALEFKKTGFSVDHSINNLELSYTLTHELGHFLGLDHQFDPEIPSVMSYDFESPELTTYDFEAIQELYAK